MKAMGTGQKQRILFSVPVRYFYVAVAIYLVLPLILFFCGWVKWWLAAPVATGILYAAWCFVKTAPYAQQSCHVARRTLISLLVGILLLQVWVYYSGIGYFALQSHDFHARNGTYEDLVNYAWPVTYPDGKILNYYIGFWLPAALAAKVTNLEVGKYVLHLWTLTGVGLIWGALCLFCRKISLVPVLLLIFWGTFRDLYGQIAWHISNMGWIPGLPTYPSSEYASNTLMMYDLHNSYVTTALISVLLLLRVRVFHIMFFYAAMAIMSPIACVALLPVVVYMMLREMRVDKNVLLRGLFSFESIACYAVGGLLLLYYSANSGAQGTIGVDVSYLSPERLPVYFVSMLPWIVLLFFSQKKNPIFWIATLALLFVPVIVMKATLSDGFFWNDVASKGFVPYSTIVMALVSKRLFEAGIREKIVLILCFLIVSYHSSKAIFAKISYHLHPDPSVPMINTKWNNTLNIQDKSTANFYADQLPFVFRHTTEK